MRAARPMATAERLRSTATSKPGFEPSAGAWHHAAMPSATLHAADSLGNPLTLDDPASLALVDDFVMGFISTESRAVNLIALADTDASPIVQAYCATLHLFAESRDAVANARPYLAKA